MLWDFVPLYESCQTLNIQNLVLQKFPTPVIQKQKSECFKKRHAHF